MVPRRLEFHDRRYFRSFKIASVIALAAAGLASLLFELHSAGIESRSVDIFLHSGLFSNVGYMAGGMACIWLLYAASLKLGLIPALAPCVVLTEEGLLVKNQFQVPWDAIVAAREYRISYVEFDEMWVLLEVDDTAFQIASEVNTDIAAFRKALAESNDGHLASRNILPINCQRTGIRSDKLLRCIDSYLPRQIGRVSLESIPL